MTQAEIDNNGGGDGDIDNIATADSNQTGPDTDDATVPVKLPPRILDGALVTNTNVQGQYVTLTFTEVATADFRDSLHAAAKIYDLNAQGQQGSVIQDVGFDINTTANYNVALEATLGTKAIVSSFVLEGVIIQGVGNAQLEKNDAAAGPDRTALTAVIDPLNNPATQLKTDSIDGTGNIDLFTDTTPANLTYYYGGVANGPDTLTGGAGRDVLNGGGGIDTLNGMAGNDILIYDNLNNDTLNGGLDFDILRIDNGAVALTQLDSVNNANTLDSSDNVPVDISGKLISNIEIILITEEAGSSTVDFDPSLPGIQADPNDDVGTELTIRAVDVFDYTDADHQLWIVGSPGDVVNLGAAGDWIDFRRQCWQRHHWYCMGRDRWPELHSICGPERRACLYRDRDSDAVRLMRSCHESVEPIRTLFACVVSIPMCKT